MTSGRARALVDACHPAPTVTVTIIVAALAWAAGRDPAGIALMAIATLAGQLSVGWCNDAFDADRDRRAGRTAKPTVRGDVTAATLWRLSVVALAATVVLSFLAAGPLGGAAYIGFVVCGWAYNLRLKATVLSPLPYAVAFGLIPAFVTYGLTPPVPPAPWLVAAGALLGVGAHFANAIPDADTDEAVGAGGIVSAIGVRASSVAALVCLVGAVGLLVAQLRVASWVAVGAVLLAAGGAVVVIARDRGTGQALFRYISALAVLSVLLLVLSARTLTA